MKAQWYYSNAYSLTVRILFSTSLLHVCLSSSLSHLTPLDLLAHVNSSTSRPYCRYPYRGSGSAASGAHTPHITSIAKLTAPSHFHNQVIRNGLQQCYHGGEQGDRQRGKLNVPFKPRDLRHRRTYHRRHRFHHQHSSGLVWIAGPYPYKVLHAYAGFNIH